MEFLNGGSTGCTGRSKPRRPVRARRGGAAKLDREAGTRRSTAAHSQGIVHRDLKPGNVLLQHPVRREPGATPLPGTPPADGEAQPKVADFGLARRGLSGDLTHAGTLVGTPAYMAPEQATGQHTAVGPAADVYAVGVVLYECLAGVPPFRGDDHWAGLRQVVTADPPPLTPLCPGVPRDLD